jgi:tetratricopeptide (TPR) repeat protein
MKALRIGMLVAGVGFSACSKTPATASSAAATSGDEDPSMTPLARRVPKDQAPPAAAAPAKAAPTLVKAAPVPKLAEVSPEGDKNIAASWGAPEAESGAPLPKRPVPNGNAQSALRSGAVALSAGKLEEAKKSFARALAADAKAYQAEYALGVIADRQGNSDEALQHYANALRIQPDYEAAVQGGANIMTRRGPPDAAVKYVEPVAKQWQRNLYLQAIYADTLVHADRLDEAEQAARAALKRDERFVPAIVSLAKASERRGRTELADSTLEQGHEINASYAEIYFLQGKRAQDKGDVAAALTAYRKAVELNPEYAEARMALGIQSMASGNYDEARVQFEAAVTLVPTLVAAHLNLGDVYRALHRWQDAKREFDKALRMQVTLPEAHYDLALMYMSVGTEFAGLSTLDALQRALTEFNTYRSQLGARLLPSDPSNAYMQDTQRQIDREKKRIEREKAKAAKDAARKAKTPDNK